MKSFPSETMTTRYVKIENSTGLNSTEKNISKRKSSHAFFLYDGLDKTRKDRIQKLIDDFNEDDIKISKLGCSPLENRTPDENIEIFLNALGNKIITEEIGSDTIIFMNFHTHSDDENLSFSIKGIDENIRVPVETVYRYVWSFFNEGERPSFHNLGCNSGYYSKDLQHEDGHVINYAGQSAIGSKEGISQASEVLRFVVLSKSFDGHMPSPEKIWQHMESYATQEMSITGKGSYMVHQPMELPSSTINGYFNPNKGHKNPKLLIEYAFRHRPMEQVIKLIEIHDPKHKIIDKLSEKAKKRILFHIVPNRVSWPNFNQYLVDKSFFEKWLEDTDSLQKLLFCHEHNLLPKSIDKNTADKFLNNCCEEGNAKVAKIVLNMPEFPISNLGLKSAFMTSIRLKNLELFEILFDRVTDFHIKNKTLDTVFHFASSHPSSEVIKLLLGPKSLYKYYGKSLNERIEERVFLLNEKNNDGVCALELAIKKNNTETVKLLLEAGANPHIPNSKGKNFLHQAVFRGNAAIVKLLLARESEIGAINVDISPLLRRAIFKSEREIALMLIAHCAMKGKKSEINAQYDSGMTPLLLAVKKRDGKLITALLAAGADPTTTSKSGQNVLHKILKEHRRSVEDSPSTTSPRKTSSEKNINQDLNFSQTEGIVKSLIKYGAAVNGRDNAGNTPAIIAAQAKNDRLVKLLLSQGADINAKNNEGRTLLHYALENQDRNLSNHLLENGIDLDAESFNLDSALVLATKSNDDLAHKHITAAIDRKKLNNV